MYRDRLFNMPWRECPHQQQQEQPLLCQGGRTSPTQQQRAGGGTDPVHDRALPSPAGAGPSTDPGGAGPDVGTTGPPGADDAAGAGSDYAELELNEDEDEEEDVDVDVDVDEPDPSGPFGPTVEGTLAQLVVQQTGQAETLSRILELMSKSSTGSNPHSQTQSATSQQHN